MRVLTFEIDGERYGLEASAVCEVLPAAQLTPVAGSPAALEGMLNVRGSVVRVVSARACLSLDAAPMRASDHLIVASIGGSRFALHVDRAVDIFELDDSTVESDRAQISSDLCGTSLARLSDGILVIHDLAALLSTVLEQNDTPHDEAVTSR